MRIVIISGIDPSGGAGFIQDVKVSTTLGAKVSGTIACTTVQSTEEVRDVHFRDEEEILRELSIIEKPDVIKVGLAKPTLIPYLRDLFSDIPIVWNPILRSSSGYLFLTVEEVRKYLDDVDYIVVNTEEAKKVGIRSNMLITGGHEHGDKLKVRLKDFSFETERIPGKFHGTGCAFSTAFAIFLGMKYHPEEALRAAANFMVKVLKNSRGYVETSNVSRNWMKHVVTEELNSVIEELLEMAKLTVPEVGQNMSYALPWAQNEEEVAKFPGRIRLVNGQGRICFKADFKGSSHTTRMVLEMMKHFPYMRCAANVKYTSSYVEKAMKFGWKVYHLKRDEEPEFLKKREGNSLNWGVSQVIKALKAPPDVIWDEGYWGKEAMIRVFGREPAEVLRKIRSMVLS